MSSLIKYAKKLRKEMTEAEKTLWYILQSKNLQGLKVIRFWNNEVLNNRDGVVEEIIKYLSPSPISPPIKGGGKSSFLIDREKLNSGKSKVLRSLRDLR